LACDFDPHDMAARLMCERLVASGLNLNSLEDSTGPDQQDLSQRPTPAMERQRNNQNFRC
jgi:hypothetical protein